MLPSAWSFALDGWSGSVACSWMFRFHRTQRHQSIRRARGRRLGFFGFAALPRRLELQHQFCDDVECVEFVYLPDVACDRLRRRQIFVAGCRRDFLCVEMPAGAIAFAAFGLCERARPSSDRVKSLSPLVAVSVVGHVVSVASTRRRACRYPHARPRPTSPPGRGSRNGAKAVPGILSYSRKPLISLAGGQGFEP